MLPCEGPRSAERSISLHTGPSHSVLVPVCGEALGIEAISAIPPDFPLSSKQVIIGTPYPADTGPPSLAGFVFLGLNVSEFSANQCADPARVDLLPIRVNDDRPSSLRTTLQRRPLPPWRRFYG
jgi:hypothetical protein